MKNIYVLTLTLLVVTEANSQQEVLKSVDYGLQKMLGNVPMELLINDVRFIDGKDDSIDIVRFDHIGQGLYPLIISSRKPIATDSLGILSFSLPKDQLENLMDLIDHQNAKIYSREFDDVLIRVTYRLNMEVKQYYVTNAKITSIFLRTIEKKIDSPSNHEPLDQFRKFSAQTGLLIIDKGKFVWKHW